MKIATLSFTSAARRQLAQAAAEKLRPMLVPALKTAATAALAGKGAGAAALWLDSWAPDAAKAIGAEVAGLALDAIDSDALDVKVTDGPELPCVLGPEQQTELGNRLIALLEPAMYPDPNATTIEPRERLATRVVVNEIEQLIRGLGFRIIPAPR